MSQHNQQNPQFNPIREPTMNEIQVTPEQEAAYNQFLAECGRKHKAETIAATIELMPVIALDHKQFMNESMLEICRMYEVLNNEKVLFCNEAIGSPLRTARVDYMNSITNTINSYLDDLKSKPLPHDWPMH
jgi:hypothetical protein